VSYRVRRPRSVLTRVEAHAREDHLLACMTPEGRAVVEGLLAELEQPGTGWYEVLLVRRVAEQCAWHALAVRGVLEGRLTRAAAEDRAARQLQLPLRTLRSREESWRPERGNSPSATLRVDLDPGASCG